MFDHLSAGLEHRPLDALEVPAGPGGVLQFAADDPGQVECQQLQQQAGLIGLERIGRQPVADAGVELPESIFERSPVAVVGQQIPGALSAGIPVGDQEEVVREELSQAGLGVRQVDYDQDQPIRTCPTLGAVCAQFDGELVAFLGRPAWGTREVRLGQFVQAGVVLEPPDEAHGLIV